MNRKEFEIFEKWRKEKYKIDLEKLQNNLAERGLHQSGIRVKEESWLKDEYEAEVAKSKAEMEDYENEKKEKGRDRVIQRIVNYIIAGVAFSALIVSFLTYQNIVSTDQKINRPHLALEDSTLGFTEVAQKSERFNQLKFETFLVNIGNLPAEFNIVDTHHKGYNGIFWLPEEPTNGIIFPDQKIRLSWILEWNKEAEDFQEWLKEGWDPVFPFEVTQISIKVDYSLLDDENNLYFTELESILTRIPDGRIGTVEFSWSIVGAN